MEFGEIEPVKAGAEARHPKDDGFGEVEPVNDGFGEMEPVNDGFGEVEPVESKQDLGFWERKRLELEAKTGDKTSWGELAVNKTVGFGIDELKETVDEYSEQRLMKGEEDNPLKMVELARRIGLTQEQIDKVTARADSGKRSIGGFKLAPNADVLKQGFAELAKAKVAERVRTREAAQERLANAEEQSTMGAIGSGVVDMASMPLKFANTATIGATTMINVGNRVGALQRDTYTLDEDGNPVLVKEGDSGTAALVKGTAGGVAETLVWTKLNKIGGPLLKPVGKAMSKIPGVGKLFDGAVKGVAGAGEKLAAKLGKSEGGRLALKTVDVLGDIEDKIHLGSLPGMVAKTRITEFLDEVVGLNAREGEREKFGEWLGKVTSVEDNVRLLTGLIGFHAITAGVGAYRAHRFNKEFRGTGREEIVGEFIGADRAKKLSNEDLEMMYRIVTSPGLTAEKAGEFLDGLKGDLKAAGEQLQGELARRREVTPEQEEKLDAKIAEYAGGNETIAEKVKADILSKMQDSRAIDMPEMLDEMVAMSAREYEPEARRMKVHDLRGSGKTEGEKLSGIEELGVTSWEAAEAEGLTEKDRFGRYGGGARRALHISIEGTEKLKAAVKAGEISGEMAEELLTAAQCELGARPAEERAALIDGIIDRARGDEALARRMIERLEEEDRGGETQRTLDERLDRAAAEAKVDAIKERNPGASDVEARGAAVEPVETEDGRMTTLGEVVGAGERPSTETAEGRPQSALEGVEMAERLKGTKLKAVGGGWMTTEKFPELRVSVSSEGVEAVGLSAEMMAKPENTADVAAVLAQMTRIAKRNGVGVMFPDQASADIAKAIVREVKEQGLAKAQAKLDTRSKLFNLLFKTALATGVTYDEAGFKEGLAKVPNGRQFIDKHGNIYGFVDGEGGVHFNPVALNFNTPIHEYGHLALEAIKGFNNKLWQRGMDLVKESDYYREIERQSEIEGHEYSYLKGKVDQICDEALATLIGDRGEKLVTEKGLEAPLKAWLKEFWKAFKGAFGLADLSDEQVERMTLAEFADAVNAELLKGGEFGTKKKIPPSERSVRRYDEAEGSGSNGMLRWKNDRGYLFAIPVDQEKTKPGGKVVFATDDANVTDWIKSRLNGVELRMSKTGKIYVKGRNGLDGELAEIFGRFPKAGLNDGIFETMAEELQNERLRDLTPDKLVDMLAKDRANYDRWVKATRDGKTSLEDTRMEEYYSEQAAREEAEARQRWEDSGMDVPEYILSRIEDGDPGFDLDWETMRELAHEEAEGRFAVGGRVAASNMGIKGAAEAEAMEKTGADREKIWRETGWWKGKDGKWRFELPRMRREAWHGDPEERHFTGGGDDFYRYRLTELVKNDDFFKAYPQAKKITVEFHKGMPTNVGGNFNEATLTIKLPQRYQVITDYAKYGLGEGKAAGLNAAGAKTIEHELQHAVQLFEGFAKGGSPSDPVRPYALDGDTGHALSVFAEANGMDVTNDRHLAIIASNAQKIASDQTRGEMSKRLVEAFEAAAKVAGKTPAEFSDEINRLYDSHTDSPMGQYFKLAGEVEARNAQFRANMTPEERAATPPWETEDVPESRQIVKFAVGRVDGKDMAVIVHEPMRKADMKNEKKVKDYLVENLVGREYRQAGEEKLVKVAPALAKEYWGGSYSSKIRDRFEKLWQAKVGAASVMEDIVGTTPLGGAEAPKSTGKRQSFKKGATFYRCKTTFGALTTDDKIAKYPCELVLLELANGKRFVYDIVNIRNPTLAHDSPKGEALEALKAQTSARSRTTDDIIAQTGAGAQGGERSFNGVTPEQDAAYAEAVKRGDLEAARRMEREVYERMGYSDDSSYQGTSAFNGAAPSRNAYFETKAERIEAAKNGEMEDTTTLGDYRDGIDVNNLQFIVFDPRSERNADPMRQEAIRNIRGVLDSGAKTITMYRSVPAAVKEGQLRNGDWITPSRAYAEENAQIHGWGDKFRVIEQEVSVEDVWWDGNDIAEWGFDDGRGSVYKNTAANRKLLGPTYDDAGNLIPLSKRFNDWKNDARFAVGGQSATRQFKNWFGGSKVVDENGEPLKVYRGAEYDPLAQEPGKGVIKPEAYFTTDPEYAKRYTGNGGKVQAYYLNIRNPFDIRRPECLADLKKVYPDHEFQKGKSGALDWAEASTIDGEFLKENFGDKYDGIIYDEGGDPGESGVSYRGISYVPLDGGAQVKSATDNIGTFDPGNPDVRFHVGKGREDWSWLDESIFQVKPSLATVAMGEREQKPAGLAAAVEKREALRPWTKKQSPADLAKPIAFDAADMVMFWRAVSGSLRNPHVQKGERIKGRPSAIGLNVGGDRIEIVSKLFGVIDASDVKTLREACKADGFFQNEDPDWAAKRSKASVQAEIDRSNAELDKRTRELFRKRVETGEGGEHYATEVLGHEIGHTLGLLPAGAQLGPIGNAAMTLYKAMEREWKRQISETRKVGDAAKNVKGEITRLIAWWHGQEKMPDYYRKPNEMFAELFGIFLTQPESVQAAAPHAYDACVKIIAGNDKLAAAYRKIAGLKWSGKSNDRVMDEVRKTWEKEAQDQYRKLRQMSRESVSLKRDWFSYALNDRFGPMFNIARRGLAAEKKLLEEAVRTGAMSEAEAKDRLAEKEAEINALKTSLYDWQRQSGGQTRLMIAEFDEVRDAAERDGTSWNDVRDYAHLMRVIELGGRATAHGMDPARASATLEDMQKRMGAAAFANVEKTWKAFRAVYERSVLEDANVREIFDDATMKLLYENKHYVTMKHRMGVEESAEWQRRIEEYRKGNKDAWDPCIDIQERLHRGFGSGGDGERGFVLHRLEGSFEATEDPLAATIRRAIEIKESAARNHLLKQMSETLRTLGAKGVYDTAIEKGAKPRTVDGAVYGKLAYMEGGVRHELIVPKVVYKSFKTENTSFGAFGAAMRFIRNTMTLWNPMFINRAYLVDKSALETNLKGMHKAPIDVLSEALCIRGIGVPLYLANNYLTRFTPIANTWVGKLLWNENTANHYAHQAQKIARMCYEGKFGERLSEARELREMGETGKAAEIEQNVAIAKEMLRRNVFQSAYEFNREQAGFDTDAIMQQFGYRIDGGKDPATWRGRAWAKRKAAGRWWNRFEEEQEAVTKIIAYLYEMKKGGNADAVARTVIEQGGTPNLAARGVFASYIENATGFFWNVRKEGALRTVRALKDHPTEWICKNLAQTALPALLKGLMVTGGLEVLIRSLFDDDDEKVKRSWWAPAVIEHARFMNAAMKCVPGYYQRNYNIIPLAKFGDHVLSMRVKYSPEEFAAQNAIHTAFQMFGKDPTDPDADWSTLASGMWSEFLPDIFGRNYALDAVGTIVGPLLGVNPYDNYRQRNIYDDATWKTRWDKPGHMLQEIGKNFWNYSPLGTFTATFKNGQERRLEDTDVPAWLDRVLATPVVSRIPASMLTITSSDTYVKALGRVDQKRRAYAKLVAQDILADCIANGRLGGFDDALKDLPPELRVITIRHVINGWRQYHMDPAAKTLKRMRAIKDPHLKARARQWIEDGMKDD